MLLNKKMLHLCCDKLGSHNLVGALLQSLDQSCEDRATRLERADDVFRWRLQQANDFAHQIFFGFELHQYFELVVADEDCRVNVSGFQRGLFTLFSEVTYQIGGLFGVARKKNRRVSFQRIVKSFVALDRKSVV